MSETEVKIKSFKKKKKKKAKGIELLEKRKNQCIAIERDDIDE